MRIVGSRSHRGSSLDAFLEKVGESDMLPMGSSLKFCVVAEGRADIYPRLGPTSEWDTAAAQAVVEQAGGKVLELDGKPLSYNAKEDILNPWFVRHRSHGPGLAGAACKRRVAWAEMTDKVDTESFKNLERLRELRVSHRDLDYLIDRLQHDPMVDQLRIRRLKKRKLLIKDMIASLESELIPDLDA